MTAPYGPQHHQSGQSFPPWPPQPYGLHPQPGEDPLQPPTPMQRPALLTLSVVLIITGSMLLMTELALIWLFVYIAKDGLGYSGTDGVFYHMFERFHLQMLEGLAWVGFGFPTAAVVLAFFLLMRKPWPRIAISLLGALAIVVSAFVLSDHLTWMIPVGVYVAFAVVMLWTPAVTAWCTDRSTQNPTP
ncbi:MAG: hypothetical protein J2P23_06655 [Microlunatus sp.]|nr:hypothetical protein [Microlunatus sp.]